MGLSTFLVSLLLVSPNLVSALGRPYDPVFDKAAQFRGKTTVEVGPKTLNELTTEIQRNAWELERQTFCRNSTRGQIFFADQYDSYREFMISTPWLLRYPSQLRARLEANGFYVSERPVNTCHWLSMGGFRSKGIYRGKLAYRHYLPMEYTTGDSRDAGYPHPALLSRVQDIVNGTFPGTELAMILCFSLLPVVLLAVWLASRLCNGWSLQRNCGGGERIEDDCVELVDTPKKKNDASDVADEVDDNKKAGLPVSTSTEIA